MTESADLYVNGIRKQLNNYFATWMPNAQHHLGDVGIFSGNYFVKVTSLEELKISFNKREDNNSKTSINCVSITGVKKTSKIYAESDILIPVSPISRAEIEIEFDKKGAYIFEAEMSYESSITDLIQVELDIHRVFENAEWKADWCIISRIVHTPTASIIISNSSQSKLVMSIKSDIPIAAGIKLGDGNVNLSVVSETGSIFKAINATNLTPFFQVHQLEARPFEKIQEFFSGMNELQNIIASKIKPMDVITPKS
jgi:hypothetical protein